MRRGLGDTLMSLAAVGVLLLALAAVQDRYRDRFSLLFGDSRAQLAGVGSDVRELTSMAIEAVRHHSIDHAPMVIFVLAAAVLVLFMLRT